LISNCPDESVLINVILPHSFLIGFPFYEILEFGSSI